MFIMVLADTRHGIVGWKKWLIAGWAFMECLLFGGILLGWSSLVFVLKREEIYADLCPSYNINLNVSVLPLPNQSQDKLSMDIYATQQVNDTRLQHLSQNRLSFYIRDIDHDNETEYAHSEEYARIGGIQRTCRAQDARMALCFTIASAVVCAGCAVVGHVSYTCGTRVTRLLSFSAFTAGCLMMAFISKDTPWLMFPGLSLLGMGGIPLLVTNTQVSNLFLVGSSTVVGLLCGGFDISSAVMLIVKLGHDVGYRRRDMFIGIACLHLLVLVSTFLFLPTDFIARPELHAAADKEIAEDLLTDTIVIPKTKSNAILPSLRSCLCRPVFITHVVWLCLLQLRFFYFIGTLNQYLNRILNEDKSQVSNFTNMCFTIMIGGIFTSPLAGIVHDMIRRMCKDGKSSAYREVLPAALPQAVGSLLAVLLSVLVLLPSTNVLYLTFIIMTVFRSFLYSMAAAFISAIFPPQYFALLYGVMVVCSGAVGFLQFAFFTWAEQYTKAPLHADILLMVLACISLLHPLYIWISSLQKEKHVKANFRLQR